MPILKCRQIMLLLRSKPPKVSVLSWISSHVITVAYKALTICNCPMSLTSQPNAYGPVYTSCSWNPICILPQSFGASCSFSRYLHACFLSFMSFFRCIYLVSSFLAILSEISLSFLPLSKNTHSTLFPFAASCFIFLFSSYCFFEFTVSFLTFLASFIQNVAFSKERGVFLYVLFIAVYPDLRRLLSK